MKDAHIFTEEIYQAYYPVFEKMCRRKMNYDPAFNDLIDETLQEVFILAFEQYPVLKDHPNLLGWLMKTCNHRLLPYAQQQRYRQGKKAFSIDDEKAPELADEQDLIEKSLQKQENRQLIDQIILQLSPKEKQVFDAFFVNNQPIAHIAKKQSTSVGAIKALIYRIRQKAKKNNKTFLFFSSPFACAFTIPYEREIPMKKRLNKNEEKIMALYHMVEAGQLPLERFEKMVDEAVEQELAKDTRQVNGSLIAFCEELLATVKKENDLAPSGQKRNWKVIRRYMNRKRREEKVPDSWGLRLAKTGAFLVVILLGVEVFLSHQRFITGPSTDQSQYIVTAQTYRPGTIPVTSAGQEGEGTKKEAVYTFKTLDELAQNIGQDPKVPHALPQGWQAQSYKLKIRWMEWADEITAAYTGPGGKKAEYRYRGSEIPEDLSQSYAQSRQGETVELKKGLKVYFSSNGDDLLAVWKKPNELYHIIGPISREEAEEMILSIP